MPAARAAIRVSVALLAALAAACQRTAPQAGSARVVPQVGPLHPKRVSFSPLDKDRLLVMEASGLVGIWDVPSQTSPQLFTSIAAGAIDAAFSPDGKTVLTAGTDGRLRGWSVDGQLKWTSHGGHRRPARAIAVAPEVIATGGEDGVIRLWRYDGTPISEIAKAHDGPVMSIAISPRGDLASLGGDEVVRLWKRTAGGAEAATFEASVLFRPERRRYPEGFIALFRYDVSWGWDHSVAFSPRGDVVAAVLFDGSLRFWNAEGTAGAVVAKAHRERQVRALAFSPAGDSLASGGFDSSLRLWNVDGSPRRAPIEAHYNNVFSVAFSNDGTRIATAGWDDRVRIWKADGAREVELPRADEERITTIAVAPAAPVLAAAYKGGGVQLWNLDGSPHGAPLAVGSGGIVQALTFSAHDVLASATSDGAIRLWNLDGKPRDASLAFDSNALLYSTVTLSFSPDGKALAVGATPFQVWNEKGLLWKQPLRRADSIASIAFSPRGDFIVTGSALGDIQVWNSDGTSRVGPLKQRWEHVSVLALAPTADYVAAVVGIDPAISLVNVDGSPRGTLTGHFGQVRALAFSPTGRLVSGGDDGIVRFWTLPSGEVETIDVGLPISQLGFRGDELWVRANGETVFFYAPNRTLLATMLLRRDAAVVYTADGWYAGSDRFEVRLYDAAGQALSASQAGGHVAPERVLQAIADQPRA